MKKVTCFVRPHRVEVVKSAIASMEVTGLTVGDVRGRGASPEHSAHFGGHERIAAMPIQSRIEVVVPDEMVDSVVEVILQTARTGEPGDGKIWITPVEDAVRVRTGERGDAAV